MFRDRETANKKTFIRSDFDEITKHWHELSDKDLDKLLEATSKLVKWVSRKASGDEDMPPIPKPPEPRMISEDR